MTLPEEPRAHKLGPWTATALVVGNIIGVGVYVLPASLAPFGWGSLLGWGVTVAGALCLAWVFATLARHLPDAGGAMGAVRLALGGDAAFLNAWGYWISAWVANAVITIGGVNYLAKLLPALERSRPLAAAVGVAVLWALTALNLRGLRTAGRIQLVTTILKLWPFVATAGVAALLLLASAPAGGAPVVQPFVAAQLTPSVATATVTLTLYSMLGVESAAVPASAVEHPTRVVPLATMAGTAVSGLLNAGACLAVVLMTAPADLARSTAPLVEFVARRLGPLGAASVSLAVVISAFGCLNGWVLIAAEIPTALAEAGELPPWWARRNRRGASTSALFVSTALPSLLVALNATDAMSSVVTFALLLAAATALLLYVMAPIAALVFAARGVVPRSAPLYAAVAGSLVFAAWAILGAGRDALIWGALLVGAGWPLYRVMKARATSARATNL